MLQVCSGFEGVGSAGHFVWLIADDDEGALETMSAGGDAAWASIGGLPMAKGARTQIFFPPICSLHHEPIPKCIDSVSVFALAMVPLFFFFLFLLPSSLGVVVAQSRSHREQKLVLLPAGLEVVVAHSRTNFLVHARCP